MRLLLEYLLLIILACCIINSSADDIERTARKGVIYKLLRDMVNQTQADTLNLPANATSIRENITDTFSCENRTYGYYADVDNDCQIFHVCLTSQSARGRNTTYRWSFICPNETVFNQEVLTCTRPRDSIPCEESPMFYHLNDEIGKMPNDTENMQTEMVETTNNNNNRRKKPLKKQNIIVENLIKEVKKEKLVMTNLDEELAPVIEETVVDTEKDSKEIEISKLSNEKMDKQDLKEEKDMTMAKKQSTNQAYNKKIVIVNSFTKTEDKVKGTDEVKKEHNKKVNKESLKNDKKDKVAKHENNKDGTIEADMNPEIHEVNMPYTMKGKRMENARLAAERKGRKIDRGLIRFKTDASKF